MRKWLVALVLLGVGTAGAIKIWRERASPGSIEPRDDDDVAAAPKEVVDDGDVAEAPIVEHDGVSLDLSTQVPEVELTPVTTESAAERPTGAPIEPNASGPAVAAAAPDGGIEDQPGGATKLAEGEARRKAIGLVDAAGKHSDPIEQTRLLSEAVLSGSLDRESEAKAYQTLLEAHQRGLLSPRVHDRCLLVEVVDGDSLWRICKRVAKDGHAGVTPGLIQLVNGMTSDRIRAGAKLKIPNAPVSILVEKSKYRLSVLIGDLLMRRYLVGIGKDNKTPEGDFTIKSRLVDPPWFPPGGGQIPAGDPENVLGTRWLGFAEKPGFADAATFGIHGTREDDSIGTQSSNGCVRMHNQEVEELFEWIGEGVTVTIQP